MFALTSIKISNRKLIASLFCNKGVTSLETALLTPFIFLFLLLVLQLAFFLLSAQATQYAAFMAARSYLVYGNASLGDIQYQNTANTLGVGSDGGLYTDDTQTVAESVAERIIFEALPWEHDRIAVIDEQDWFTKRVYLDGADGHNSSTNNGAVRADQVIRDVVVDSKSYQIEGVRVTYCMPSLFSGLVDYFTAIAPQANLNTCLDVRDAGNGKPLAGVPIVFETYLGREP